MNQRCHFAAPADSRDAWEPRSKKIIAKMRRPNLRQVGESGVSFCCPRGLPRHWEPRSTKIIAKMRRENLRQVGESGVSFRCFRGLPRHWEPRSTKETYCENAPTELTPSRRMMGAISLLPRAPAPLGTHKYHRKFLRKCVARTYAKSVNEGCHFAAPAGSRATGRLEVLKAIAAKVRSENSRQVGE